MALLDAFMGDREEIREAKRILRERDDFVFQAVPGEDKDLAIHVRAGNARVQTLNARLRVGLEQNERDISGLRLLIIFGFAFALAKLYGGADLLWHLLQSL